MPAAPLELSVVVVAGGHRGRVEACLRSVFEQDAIDRCEVIVVDADESNRPWSGPYSSRATIVKVAADRHYGEALAAGVHAARAPVVAFLEEHALARPGWAAALIEIHRGECDAAACEVHVGNPGVGLSEGWGLIGYGLWYAPLPAGPARFLHGYNSSCRRDVLLAFGDRLADLILADAAFAERLTLDGRKLVNCPAAKIDHLNETTLLEPLLKNFLAHRFSASVRATECEWSVRKRLAYIGGWPLMPFYGLYCTLRSLAAHRPALLPTLLRFWPLWFVAQWTSGFATAFGLVFGPGDAAVRFTRIELNGHRPESASPDEPETSGGPAASVPFGVRDAAESRPGGRRAA